MLGYVAVNYKQIHLHHLKDLLKVKCTYAEAPAGLMRIILTLKPKEAKYDLTVNSNDAANWFVNTVRAKLYSTNKLGVPLSKF